MSIHAPSTRWLARYAREDGPIYLRLLRALESAVRSGELQPGERLPPQRTVAELLGVDFTTVTRAYSAARARGLVEGAVGRGTFVRARAAADDAELVDLSMNLPPPPQGISLGALLRRTTDAVLQRTDAAALMTYHPGAGALGHRIAGAAWLAPYMGEVSPERVLLGSGAQTSLAAVLSTICKPGDTVVAEPLSYPGAKALAAQLGLRLIACPVDGEGVLPEALERLCREERPAAVYLIPTMQNPTATTMSLQRRREVAEVVMARGLWAIEDDPYSRLVEGPVPALAALAPDRTFHIATLSKCFSPGLRLAFVVCPQGTMADRLADALRALSLMPAPLMAAVVTTWIREGAAEELLAGVRREARARREIAGKALPNTVGSDESIHVWVGLPDTLSPDRLRLSALERGLSVVTADAFATGATYANGVRISLGGTANRAVLAEALAGLTELVREPPSRRTLLV